MESPAVGRKICPLFLCFGLCLNTPLIYGAVSCEFEPDASAGLELAAFNKPSRKWLSNGAQRIAFVARRGLICSRDPQAFVLMSHRTTLKLISETNVIHALYSCCFFSPLCLMHHNFFWFDLSFIFFWWLFQIC